MKQDKSTRTQLQQEPITGKENFDKGSPLQALAEFYKAFNQRDSTLMAKNWYQGDNTAMDNPLGGIKRGWTEIGSVYDKIFKGPAEVYVEFYDYSLHEFQDCFYAVGREHGHITVAGEQLELAIRTSRIYQHVQGEWKQVHHHGSIENPKLLQQYQNLVLNQN